MPVHRSDISLGTLQCHKHPETSAFVVWHFGCLQEVYVKCVADRVLNSPFLNNVSFECSSYLANVLQAAWLFILVKVSVLSREYRLDRLRFRLCWALRCCAVGVLGSVSSVENVQLYFYWISLFIPLRPGGPEGRLCRGAVRRPSVRPSRDLLKSTPPTGFNGFFFKTWEKWSIPSGVTHIEIWILSNNC